jgi:hypothetical protein
MAQAVGEFGEVALEIGEIEHRRRFASWFRPYQCAWMQEAGCR